MGKQDSDYTYDFDGYKFIITYLNLGNNSVTNNIENIIADIMESDEQVPPHKVAADYIWHYYDSEGVLTGYDYKTETFYNP